jgi:hypothetical protein
VVSGQWSVVSDHWLLNTKNAKILKTGDRASSSLFEFPTCGHLMKYNIVFIKSPLNFTIKGVIKWD